MQSETNNKDSIALRKNSIFIGVFFILAPIALAISLISLITLSKTSPGEVKSVKSFIDEPTGYQVYASLPSDLPSISGEAIGMDARKELIRQYLERYDSPLEEFAGLLVDTSDTYKLDYRLLTAIAQQESNLCKKIPADSYNCWGWGIHSRGTLKFESYPEAIETVSKGIKEEYIDKGLTTPEEIMGKYTPLSNGSWADGVNLFLSQMK
jgi:hypothetical protein